MTSRHPPPWSRFLVLKIVHYRHKILDPIILKAVTSFIDHRLVNFSNLISYLSSQDVYTHIFELVFNLMSESIKNKQ